MDGSHSCDFCPEWFFDKEELKDHVKKEHPYDYDNWTEGLVAGALGIGISLLFGEDEETETSEVFGLDDVLSDTFGSFGGGDFSGGGADDDW